MTRKIPLLFISAAALCHLAGISLGIVMGSGGDFGLAPVHAHLNLLGWVSLAIYGLAWATWPDLGGERTALAHLILSVAAGLGFPLGLWLELAGQSLVPLIISALGWAVSALLFLVLVIRKAIRH